MEKSGEAPKVVIILHGVTGKSIDNYVVEMVGEAAEKGYHCVVMNHFAPPGETNLRLMDFTKNKYLDEVVRHVNTKYSKQAQC